MFGSRTTPHPRRSPVNQSRDDSLDVNMGVEGVPVVLSLCPLGLCSLLVCFVQFFCSILSHSDRTPATKALTLSLHSYMVQYVHRHLGDGCPLPRTLSHMGTIVDYIPAGFTSNTGDGV